eukprot:599316-Karenia_brevis.AAC.1
MMMMMLMVVVMMMMMMMMRTLLFFTVFDGLAPDVLGSTTMVEHAALGEPLGLGNCRDGASDEGIGGLVKSSATASDKDACGCGVAGLGGAPLRMASDEDACGCGVAAAGRAHMGRGTASPRGVPLIEMWCLKNASKADRNTAWHVVPVKLFPAISLTRLFT